MADIITPNIYKISKTISDLQNEFIDEVNEDVLVTSMFGFMHSALSEISQNQINLASAYGNESIHLLAKMDKTILTECISYSIKNVNAVPATMNVMIGMIKSELDSIMTMGKFRISKNCPIYIGKYEFRLEHDIVISKKEIPNKESVYTAIYDIESTNNITTIEDPIIDPPIQLVKNNDMFIFVNCILRQYTVKKEFKSVISNNILENKIIDFSFNESIADFEVIVIDGNGDKVKLTPIYEGLPITSSLYCFYNWINSDTIRIKFDRDSYDPDRNATVQINIIETLGNEGNIEYVPKDENDDIICSLTSDDIDYDNTSILVMPRSAASRGRDRKSMAVLKEMISREMLARGTITSDKDLDNYFNEIDSDNRIKFEKKIDNQKRRVRFGYFLAKDSIGNIIPTNTVDIKIRRSEFDVDDKDNERLILNQGTPIVYSSGEYCRIDRNFEDSKPKFVYASPFNIAINRNHLSTSHYLNIINDDYYTKFVYINQNAFEHFISKSISISKINMEDKIYDISLSLSQNSNIDYNLIQLDDNDNIISSKLYPILAFTPEGSKTKYYVRGTITSYDKNTFSYEVQFKMESGDSINTKNQIRLSNLFVKGTTDKASVFVDSEIDMELYIYADLGKDYGNKEVLDPSIPNATLSDIYSISSVKLFNNYSNVIKSLVNLAPGDEETYILRGIPVFKKSYIDDIDKCLSVLNQINYRKSYIEDALDILEDSFEIDLKYYNTYGPSKVFKIGFNENSLNNVNIALTFRLRLYTGADINITSYIIQSIKSYVEDINNIRDDIHMSNLCTYIKDLYKDSIDFIEFVGVNGYDANYSYISKETTKIISETPEFLSINLKEDNESPDINIIPV